MDGEGWIGNRGGCVDLVRVRRGGWGGVDGEGGAWI